MKPHIEFVAFVLIMSMVVLLVYLFLSLRQPSRAVSVSTILPSPPDSPVRWVPFLPQRAGPFRVAGRSKRLGACECTKRL
jgi:hypothetical protein